MKANPYGYKAAEKAVKPYVELSFDEHDATYCIWIVVGNQAFRLGVSYEEKENAEAYARLLRKGLAYIVAELAPLVTK